MDFLFFLWVFYFLIGAFSGLDSSVLGDFRWPPFFFFFWWISLFLVDFLFPVFFCFGGFPISLFSLIFYFFIGAFLFFSFPPNSHNAHGKKEGTLIRPRPRGRGAPKLGEIEVSRDSRSVQLVLRASH